MTLMYKLLVASLWNVLPVLIHAHTGAQFKIDGKQLFVAVWLICDTVSADKWHKMFVSSSNL